MMSRARTQRQAALIYNPIKVDEKSLRASVREISKQSGWATPLFLSTTIEDAGQEAAREALGRGVDVILVAGGDGTVRAVAEAMAGSGVPLSIIPSGTGNLLARNLRLPLAVPDPMIRAAFSGVTHPIDVGWAKIQREDGSSAEHAFVVLAGMGLDADMIANTRPDLKKSVGWVAYVDGAARSLATAKPFRAVFQVADGRLHSAKVHSILFANCGMLPAGIALIPSASVTDGLMDIAVIQPNGLFGWFAVWRRIWWHNSVLSRAKLRPLVPPRRGTDASVRYLIGSSAEAAATGPTPVELDGDEFGLAVRIECRIAADALLLRLPQGHPIESF